MQDVKYWSGVSDSEYPEIVNGEVSVCVSGGGMRAATCACGWLKGFENLGIKPRYISSISGGSWFNVPYSYRTVKNSGFNGTYYSAKDCTLKNITSYMSDKKS